MNKLIILSFIALIALSYGVGSVFSQERIRTTEPSSSVVSGVGTLVGQPQRLIIPRIKVSALVESVGKDPDGRMSVPFNAVDVGWYNLGVKPGESGQAVIDGHLDTSVVPAIFQSLNRLKVGDIVQIIDSNGHLWTFQIYQVSSFPDSQFPLETVFGPSLDSRLNLITCQGDFNQQTRNYSDRLVVFSRLISSTQ
jgi:LPXTG-site transpeptidase (sortase) family protein